LPDGRRTEDKAFDSDVSAVPGGSLAIGSNRFELVAAGSAASRLGLV